MQNAKASHMNRIVEFTGWRTARGRTTSCSRSTNGNMCAQLPDRILGSLGQLDRGLAGISGEPPGALLAGRDPRPQGRRRRRTDRRRAHSRRGRRAGAVQSLGNRRRNHPALCPSGGHLDRRAARTVPDLLLCASLRPRSRRAREISRSIAGIRPARISAPNWDQCSFDPELSMGAARVRSSPGAPDIQPAGARIRATWARGVGP